MCGAGEEQKQKALKQYILLNVPPNGNEFGARRKCIHKREFNKRVSVSIETY